VIVTSEPGTGGFHSAPAGRRDWKYDWVLPVYRYEGLEPLLATLAEKVIAPAEEKVKAFEERRRIIEAKLTERGPGRRPPGVPSKELQRALDRLDVVHPAPIPIRAEPAATWCGQMVE